MSETPPAGTGGVNPVMEAFLLENLQYLQATEIQAIIQSLLSIIQTSPDPPQAQSLQDIITQ